MVVAGDDDDNATLLLVFTDDFLPEDGLAACTALPVDIFSDLSTQIQLNFNSNSTAKVTQLNRMRKHNGSGAPITTSGD